MKPLIKRFDKNEFGRDLIVGDIHAHFTLLDQALDKINFNPEFDRLFSVGDLVDRGPESHQAINWIRKPWFNAVCGNHEQMAIDWVEPDAYKDVSWYKRNGGSWNIENSVEQQTAYADAFRQLPLAIEIETDNGLVVVVHAEPTEDWDTIRGILSRPHVMNEYEFQRLRERMQWERRRIYNHDSRPVAGVRAVVVGHTPLSTPVQLGNVYYIDTAAWRSSGTGFTFLDAATLETVTVANQYE